MGCVWLCDAHTCCISWEKGLYATFLKLKINFQFSFLDPFYNFMKKNRVVVSIPTTEMRKREFEADSPLLVVWNRLILSNDKCCFKAADQREWYQSVAEVGNNVIFTFLM